MDLWIRSQENDCEQYLIKAEQVKVEMLIDKWEVKVNFYRMGTYKTRKRAIEVLDEIQNLLIDRYVWDKEYYLGSDVFIPSKDAEIKALPRTCVVYQMPADDTPPYPKR